MGFGFALEPGALSSHPISPGRELTRQAAVVLREISLLSERRLCTKLFTEHNCCLIFIKVMHIVSTEGLSWMVIYPFLFQVVILERNRFLILLTYSSLSFSGGSISSNNMLTLLFLDRPLCLPSSTGFQLNRWVFDPLAPTNLQGQLHPSFSALCS